LQAARKAEKKYIPAQIKAIQRRQSAAELKVSLQEQANEELSWMQDDNEVNQKYKQMLEDPRLSNIDGLDPEVAAQMPYLLAHAANSMYGRKVLAQPAKTATKAKPSRLVPPSGTPGSAKSDKKVSNALKTIKAASDQFKNSGNPRDFAALRRLQMASR